MYLGDVSSDSELWAAAHRLVLRGGGRAEGVAAARSTCWAGRWALLPREVPVASPSLPVAGS